jgi:RNA polymerase sigma-70 factor (ECF subfamily)
MRRSEQETGIADRIVAGDAEAERELVLRYRPLLLGMLRRRVRSQADAEDLCHEALRAALEGLRAGRLRQQERIAAYVWGIAENLARHSYRAACREPRSCEPPVETVTPAASPEEALLAHERARLVRSALGALSSRDRAVLGDYYLGEEAKPAICERMGMAPAHFDLVKHRALKRFARLWSAVAGDPLPLASPPLRIAS